MAEYIERKVALDCLKILMNSNSGFVPDVLFGFLMSINSIEIIPPADVVPVVHGYWGLKWWGEAKCSVCGTSANPEANYCPNCGAKMDGEKSD